MQQPAAPIPPALQLSPRWVLLAALALLVPLAALLASRAQRPPLPVLGELPAFALTDHTGHAFGSREMKGRVWVASFIFTSCAEACPRLVQKIRGLQDSLTARDAERIGLVSVSVDPERDTVARLRDYARSFGAQDERWRFLTGPQGEIERTVVRGFRVAMGRVRAAPEASSPAALHAEAFDILHGEQLVLVDAQGRIRGYYQADDGAGLLRDARRLAAESAS